MNPMSADDDVACPPCVPVCLLAQRNAPGMNDPLEKP
jgi:hypothetical protein